MMRNIISIVIVSLLSVSSAGANGFQRKKTVSVSQSDHLDKSKPTVYISFVRAGKIEPLETGVSNEYVWLRLHNNSRWRISICANGVPKEYGDAEVHYGIETEKPLYIEGGLSTTATKPQEQIQSKDCDLSFMSGRDTCSVIVLKPNHSLLFSVPKDYLCHNTYLYVQYSYEWEWEPQIDSALNDEPNHSVYFYGRRLADVRQSH